VASVVLGVNWKQIVERAINSGRPVAGALTVAIVVPTLLFVAARGRPLGHRLRALAPTARAVAAGR
jgi:hypothetical protein